MPLYINRATVTVIREGRRMKVKPSGQPYDFTDAEVASAEAAGISMTPYVKPTGPKVVAEKAQPEKKAQSEKKEPARRAALVDSGIDDEAL